MSPDNFIIDCSNANVYGKSFLAIGSSNCMRIFDCPHMFVWKLLKNPSFHVQYNFLEPLLKMFFTSVLMPTCHVVHFPDWYIFDTFFPRFCNFLKCSFSYPECSSNCLCLGHGWYLKSNFSHNCPVLPLNYIWEWTAINLLLNSLSYLQPKIYTYT